MIWTLQIAHVEHVNATGSGEPTSPSSRPPAAASGGSALDYATRYCRQASSQSLLDIQPPLSA